ncbi:MAG TPA: PQQ-binding-like beta-propeller repeat protein [Gemmataceae bacterium]|nr:PQQ-binding-like beta-propeller repeat protein [Gemmataceae bacterium]
MKRNSFLTTRGLLALYGSLICACSCLAEPWPRFRGPNGTGISPDKGVPVHWTEKDGVLWQAPIPGVGNSSPIVWGQHIFLESASPNGKTRLLVCLNAADGKQAWSRSFPGARAHTHERNTLASSTPATDGERVYTVFWDGNIVFLCAYDFKGNLVWKVDLGGFVSQHGVGASPIVYQGKVYLMNDQDGAAEMLAYEAKTGKQVWRVARKAFRACYSTPFLLEKAGEEAELIVTSTAGITSYRPDTGAENWGYDWTFDGMPLRTVASSISTQGLIFANSGDGSGARHTIGVKLGDGSQGARPSLVWEEKTKTFPYVPTMLAYGDHLYYVKDDGFASCRVAATGEVVWKERLGSPVSASPILVDGKIYIVSETGTVYVVAAAPAFKLLAKNKVGDEERIFASPAVADNRLYIRGDNTLYCIGTAPQKHAGRSP